MKLRLGLLAFAWLGLVAANEPQPSQATLRYFQRLGKLSAEFTGYAACAKEQIGTESFDQLQTNTRQSFGNEAAQRNQELYDYGRSVMEKIPPSQRPLIVKQMQCIEKGNALIAQINALWEDAKWSLSRDKTK